MSDFILNLLFKILVAWAAYHVCLFFFKGLSRDQLVALLVALYFFAESNITFKQ